MHGLKFQVADHLPEREINFSQPILLPCSAEITADAGSSLSDKNRLIPHHLPRQPQLPLRCIAPCDNLEIAVLDELVAQ
jgi:hypothetical protein